MADDDGRERGEGREEKSFGELLDESYADPVALSPGQKIRAKVVKISAEWIFLDLGRKGEGILDRKELCDASGLLAVREGEVVEAFYAGSRQNEIRLTTRIAGGQAGISQVEEAWRNGIPVEGHVAREIKGGYEIRLGGGLRAFCPYSQMGLPREASSEPPLGKHLPFRVTEFREKGRSVVLSHRVLLEERRQAEMAAFKASLAEGMTVRGTVSSLREFGAFIRVGSIEGLLPVSEIGWGPVGSPADVLAVGQEVEVVIVRIDPVQDRISFSLRQTLPDPWEKVPQRYPAGSVHRGKISRLTPFGAFVTLEPGVDGLLHVSRLGRGKRIRHPGEAVREGEVLEVRIETLDAARRRLSLAPAEADAGEDEAQADDLSRYLEEAPRPVGSLGELLKARLAEKKARK